jgi:uncharacterized protein (TIGR03067 family)
MSQDTSKVECPECGTGLRLKTATLGKTIRCPRCQHQFRTPVEEEAEEPARRAAASRLATKAVARAAQRGPDPQEEEDKPRPRKGRASTRPPKKGGSFPVALIAVGAVVVLLFVGGGIAGAFWLLGRNKGPTGSESKGGTTNRSGPTTVDLTDDPTQHTRLEGTWKVYESSYDPHVLLQKRFAFKGDQVAEYQWTTRQHAGTYVADMRKEPARLEIKKPGLSRPIARAIYKFDGDTLILCIAEMGLDFPATFEGQIAELPIRYVYKLRRETLQDSEELAKAHFDSDILIRGTIGHDPVTVTGKVVDTGLENTATFLTLAGHKEGDKEIVLKCYYSDPQFKPKVGQRVNLLGSLTGVVSKSPVGYETKLMDCYILP